MEEPMSLSEKITEVLKFTNGIPDRPLCEAVFRTRDRVPQINQECRFMEQRGLLERKLRPDGLIGNYLVRIRPDLRVV
jgi:hypothetical protein